MNLIKKMIQLVVLIFIGSFIFNNVNASSSETILIPIVQDYQIISKEDLVYDLQATYFKEDFQIEILYNDPNSKKVKASLYIERDEKEQFIQTKDIIDKKAIFDIKAKQVSHSKIKFRFINEKNEESKDLYLSSFDKFIKSDLFIYDKVSPTINIIYESTESGWINHNPIITVEVIDEGVGIRQIQGKINDFEIAYEFEKLTSKKEINIDTSQVKIKEDGSYVLELSSIDRLNNESINAPIMIYVDKNKPKITDVTIDDIILNKDEIYKSNQLKEMMIKVKDQEPSSKLESLYYKILDINNQVIKQDKVDIKENMALIPLEEYFSFTVKLWALDYAQNKSSVLTFPMLIETQESHDLKQHIMFNPIEDAPFHIFNQDVTYQLLVEDGEVGINQLGIQIYDESLSLLKEYTYTTDDLFQKDCLVKDDLLVSANLDLLLENHNENYIVKISMIDNCGNESILEQQVLMDNQKPNISLFYDLYDANHMFDQSRIGYLQIEEKNFSANLVDVLISLDGHIINQELSWEKYENDDHQTYYQAMIYFDLNGQYELQISAKDLAGNTSQVINDSFLIDLNEPVILVSIEDEREHGFYNHKVVAKIEIEEDTFNEELFKINYTKDSEHLYYPDYSIISQSGKYRTAQIEFEKEGLYEFDIECEDLFGRKTVSKNYHFCIDLTSPKIYFNHIEENGIVTDSFNGQISIVDAYIDMDKTILSFNENGKSIPFRQVTQLNEVSYLFDELTYEKSHDGLYILDIIAYDLSGNMTKKTVPFYINRFGSSYQDEYIKELLKPYYLKTVSHIYLSEYNVNTLTNQTLKLNVNGLIKDLVLDVDYKVDYNYFNNYHYYQYIFNDSLFLNDGLYQILISSKDLAGHYKDNYQANNEGFMAFAIDNTSPLIYISDIENKGVYHADSKKVLIMVEDNLDLDYFEVYLNEKLVSQCLDSSYHLLLKQNPQYQNIKVIAYDKTGNMQTKEIKDILVLPQEIVTKEESKGISWIYPIMIVGIVIVSWSIMKNKKQGD